jgi:hypothetical protein
MLPFLGAILLLMQTSQPTLHPALTPDEAALTRAWKAGYVRVKTDKTLFRAHQLAQRRIRGSNGKITIGVIFLHPRLRAFEQGFSAGKDNVPAEAQANSLRGLSYLLRDGAGKLRFQCEIGVYPGLNQGVQDHPNIRLMEGVTTELRVGKRTYKPLKQPGNVVATTSTGVHKWTEQVLVRRRTVKDKDGSTRTEEEYRREDHEAQYVYFTGTFDLEFDLKNGDGTPCITEADKEFTVIIQGGFGVKKATYRLNEWQTAYEK